MATREKKARSVTADSPTPSLGSANSGSNGNISALAATNSSTNTSTTTTTTSTGTGTVGAGENNSAPTTPTSTRKSAASANATSTAGGSGGSSSSTSTSTTRSLSRAKSKLVLPGSDDTAVDETTFVGVDSNATTPSSSRTTRGGGSAAQREDSAGRDSPAAIAAPKDKDDVPLASMIGSASKDPTKSPAVGARRAAATAAASAVTAKSKPATTRTTAESAKNRVVTLKRTALLKRKGKKIIGKPMLGRKVVARRQLVATGKSTGTRGAAAAVKELVASSSAKEKEEELQQNRSTPTPSLRNGKPRNSDSPVAKRKSAVQKQQERSKSPDATGLLERRRSGSISKCSDITEDGDPSGTDAKRDYLLDYESRSKMLDKMAEAFNERKAAGGGAASPGVSKDEKGQSSGGGTLRRSMRQRKSTTREREEFQTPRGKAGSSMEIKLEPAESMESLTIDEEATATGVSVDAPLTIDTTVVEGAEQLHSDGATSSSGAVSSGSASGLGRAVSASGASGAEELVVGKDPSLSPGELVSEGVSEQSVKECYSEPAFLENNLGIEKDPKLGEIVQERFRCDKVSDDNTDNAQNVTVGDGDAGDIGGGLVKDESVSTEAMVQEPVESNTLTAEDDEGMVEVQLVKEEAQEEIHIEDDQEEISVEGTKEQEDMREACEDEPMEGESGETVDDLVKEEFSQGRVEEEHMDTTEVEEVECEDMKDGPDVTANEDTSTLVLADNTPLKTDDVPAKDTSMAPETERPDSAIPVDDDDDGNSQGSKISDGVSPGDEEVDATTNKTRKAGDSSSPVPCTANGESHGTTVTTDSTTNDQSTPNNQQASRATSGQQKATGTTPKTPGTAGGKESKFKTRTTKEKSKDDEKTREEKLRQEKLRVEEKVREEKQRAERLEAEKRLKEELLQQQVLENGLEEQTTAPPETGKSGSSSPASPSQTAEKQNKTDEAASKTPLLALTGLNLPAITIAISKKDSGSGSSDEKDPLVPQPKSELEILPIKADGGAVSPPPAVVLLSKEEKPAKEGGAVAPSLADTAESRVRTVSKSEDAAAAVSVRKDSSDSNKSLSIMKRESSNGSPAATPPPKDGGAGEHKTITLDESDDAAKRKESHLKNLGLLTIRAADEEKQRRAEQKPSASSVADSQQEAGSSTGPGGRGEGWLAAGTNQSSAGSGRSGNKSTRSSKDEYTVSMKTTAVQKGGSGGRGEKRKQQRMPLKMTFQKGKGKGSGGRDSSNGSGSTSSNGSGYATDTGNNGEFYTVHSNEVSKRSENGVNLTEAVGENPPKNLVIPEKASSFNVHPERLCWDQCSYCGGKFGLYDTPCHVAAMKSTERQQRILLATLPKITLDSCLCDACYRHVDRKANCPPQKKKSSTVSQTSTGSSSGTASNTTSTVTQSTVSPLVLKVTTNKDGSASIATEQPAMVIDDGSTAGGKAREICAVRQCTGHGMQSLRRKWMVKMKRKIGKQLDINLEQAAKATTEYISICNKHYEQISYLMVCALCTKPLQRNHVYHLFNNVPHLERLIQEQGIAMRLGCTELVVCKLCKYYANLLIKPPEPKTKKAQFVNDYSRRLYNCRQMVAEEQWEQQAEAPVVAAAAPGQRQQMPVTDIIISDGDEEEEGAEEEEVEESTETQNQQQQQQQQQQPQIARFQTIGDIFSIGDSSVSLRRRVSSRKSPDVTIVESNGAAQMGELDEISIIPTSKSLSSLSQQQQQQQQQLRDDNLDMTKVLKSNPNISMRELFPGEEELGVHVNIPFSSSSMRTPEGWSKVTSTIQYDDSTRALWEELQKPYGNQSSFLRHLILLEKYFRNGDLILSPQAKNNATTYSEAVQNRLRSYDNVPSVVPSSPPALASLTPATPTAVDKTSHIFQQFSSATITIVPANKVRSKPGGTTASALSGSASSASGEVTPVSPPAPVSLLKSNNLHLTTSSGEQLGTAKNSLKRKLSNEVVLTGRTSGGANISFGSGGITSPLNSSGGSSSSVSKVAKVDDPKVPLSSPPELISISSRKPSVTITTIPTGQTVAAATTIVPIVSATTPKQHSLLNQPQQQSLLQTAASVAATLLAKKSPTAAASSSATTASTTPSATTVAGPSTGNAAREIIQMPEQLTEAERRESSTRPWRPTLLPISPGVSESLKTGPLYQTADGRTLPKLVQVMSGGKPYHISIEDYNRMCILRREKLLQQQQNMIQQTAASKRQLPAAPLQPGSKQTSIPPPALRLASVAAENSSLVGNTVVPGGAKVVQLPNQLLEQNSLIPILSGSGGGATGKHGTSGGSVNAQKNGSGGNALTVTMTTTVNNNSLAKSNSSTMKMVPLSLPNSTTVLPMMMSANSISLPSSLFASASPSASLASSSSSASGLFTGVSGAQTSSSSSLSSSSKPAATTSLVLGQPTSLLTTTTTSTAAATVNPFEHLLKDGIKVSQSRLHEFVAYATAANGGLGASSSSSSSLMDSSPAQLLSKIPKSLTVIPQQKQRSMSRVSSQEDHNSA
uniref:Uncharacterized protein n=1 Tax=Anopheles epiroticus TaxID=199890 RepID=A0A182PV78_9DIPT